MNEKRRPEGRRSQKIAAKVTSASHSTATDDIPAPERPVTYLPLRWARELIEGAGAEELPEYGGREWSDLPDDSRIKVAACVVAAENWRTRRYTFEAPAPGSRRAREVAEARRPRPGDHPGGSVPVWPAEVTSDAQ